MWIDIIIMSLFLGLFLIEPMIEFGKKMRFRIVRKYCSWDKEYIYHIERLCYFWWVKSDMGVLSRKYSSCKEAEDALEDWSLEQTTNDIILERIY